MGVGGEMDTIWTNGHMKRDERTYVSSVASITSREAFLRGEERADGLKLCVLNHVHIFSEQATATPRDSGFCVCFYSGGLDCCARDEKCKADSTRRWWFRPAVRNGRLVRVCSWKRTSGIWR